MEPLFDVVSVKVLPDYRLQVEFEDGLSGTVDVSKRLTGPVFGPLSDTALFSQAMIDCGTVTWPNGADLAPDVMYDHIKEDGHWILKPHMTSTTV